MKLRFASINTYLLCGSLMLLAAGCKSPDGEKQTPKEKEKAKKLTKEERNTMAFIRFYQQAAAGDPDRNAVINVFRAHPVELTISKSFFMDETFVEKSEVLDEGGGSFSLKLQFDRRGALLLETMTGLNLNSHIAIWTTFGVKGGDTNTVRWLAAPYIRQRIVDGTLVFTPDATRQEAEQIALGLNNAADYIRKQDLLRPR